MCLIHFGQDMNYVHVLHVIYSAGLQYKQNEYEILISRIEVRHLERDAGETRQKIKIYYTF